MQCKHIIYDVGIGEFVGLLIVYRKLQHNNLVKLYGVCTKKKPIMIVTEYMRNGLIYNHLSNCSHFFAFFTFFIEHLLYGTNTVDGSS